MRHKYYFCENLADDGILKKYRYEYVMKITKYDGTAFYREKQPLDEIVPRRFMTAGIIIRNLKEEDLTFLVLTGDVKLIPTASISYKITRQLWGKDSA